MPRPVLHIVGAGLAGLAAAVRLAEEGGEIVLHEATDHAGGRCRSYYEPALDQVIDNGNHLLLSANHAALAFLRRIGADERSARADACQLRLRRSGGWKPLADRDQ